MVLMRSFIPPRSSGAARATLSLFKNTGFNGVDQLDSNLTINGSTVTPSFKYKGGDATASVWTQWTYGCELTVAGTGNSSSINQGSPLLGTNDDSVLLAANPGKRYEAQSDDTCGDIGTEDIVVELVFRASTAGGTILGKLSANGYQLAISSSTVRMLLDDADAQLGVSSATLDNETWYHAICFVNRGESSTSGSQWYINGVASGSGANLSTVSDSLTNAIGISMNSNGEGSSVGEGVNSIAYIAMWLQDDWHQAGASGPSEWADIAAERFHRLVGTYPAKASGTKIPIASTRATSACLDKLEDSNTTRKFYQVGDGWMRIVSRLDSNTDEVQGFLSEVSATNLILQSEDLDTTWTKIDAGDTIGGSIEVPSKSTSSSSGIIGDSTNGPHGVAQSVTLTADNYTFSVFVKKGDLDYLLIDNDTIANGKVWFNLATGAVATTQAGIIGATIHDYGDGWYQCHYYFIGTVAAHSLEIRPSEADNDTTYIGDGGTVNTYAWGAQCELGNTHTSYIPTTTGTVTRNGDQLRYKGDDGNVKDNGKGRIQATILKEDYDVDADGYVISLSDGAGTADQISLYNRDDNDELKLETRATSGNQGDALGFSDIANGVKHSIIASWSTDSVGLAVDSTHEGGDNSATIPDAIDQINIGSNVSLGNQFNGVISGFALFAKTLLKGSIGESFMSHLGCAYISATASEAVVSGTFEMVAGTYTAGTLVDFTHSAGVLTYTGTETKTFIVFVAMSASSGSTNPLLRFRLGKNGTSVVESEITRDMGTAGTKGAIGMTWCIELAQNDTIEAQYTDDASSTLTADKLSLIAVSA